MSELKGVRAKLQAHKDANNGTYPVRLDASGIECTIPKFISHAAWMRAQRVAKGDTAKAQAAFVVEAVLFEGEKLTITDLAEIVPAADALQLINEIFGKEEDERGEAGEGNGQTTVN